MLSLITNMRILAIACLTALPPAAQALPMGYDIQFLDTDGTQIGAGRVTYDDAVQEDLYADIMGARCFDPTTLGCSYVDTWTPLLSLRAMILGTSIFSRGNNAELWMEGYHSFHARYLIGGYVADSWFVGDIYFGLSQFSTSPPPVEPTPFTTGFQFVSIDLPVPAVSGRAVFTPTPIPLPGSVWLIALAYLVAMPVFRHRYT